MFVSGGRECKLMADGKIRVRGEELLDSVPPPLVGIYIYIYIRYVHTFLTTITSLPYFFTLIS